MINNKFKNFSYFLTILFICLFSMTNSFADSVKPDQEWWTAIKNDNTGTVQELLLKNVDTSAFNRIGNPALIQAVREQSWQVFDLLADLSDINVDQANAYDETALMYLCILGETERAESLIKKGAKVNRLGWTPLHYAASKGQVETAKMLIAHDAIINAPGTDGTTPLMMAALSGKEDMVRLLTKNGADATMHNIKGETAADWARKGKNTSTAKLLESFVADSGEQGANSSSVDDKPVSSDTNSNPVDSENQAESESTSKYFDLDRFE